MKSLDERIDEILILSEKKEQLRLLEPEPEKALEVINEEMHRLIVNYLEETQSA